MFVAKILRSTYLRPKISYSRRAVKDSYPHDRRADKGRYRHDSRADKNPYRHDPRADSLSLFSKEILYEVFFFFFLYTDTSKKYRRN